jgi:hypothetical protein
MAGAARSPQEPPASSHDPQVDDGLLTGSRSCREAFQVPSPDRDLPLVFSRAQAQAIGYGPDTVDRQLARDRWVRLRAGQYTAERELDDHRRWQAEVLATVRSHHRTLVLAGRHAARAWGLPAPWSGWGPMSFVSDRPPVRRRGGVVVSVHVVDRIDLRQRGALWVTSPARTTIDCARLLPGVDGLVLVDAALRRGLVTTAELQEVLDRLSGWPGVRRARLVVGRASQRRETPLESSSAWVFAERDLAPPRWQCNLCDADGVFLGRADAWWDVGVVGEADGRVKYRLAALERAGLNPEGLARALDDERRREAGLRRAGALVVRWGARDILRPAAAEALVDHLRGQLESAARSNQFTGLVVEA